MVYYSDPWEDVNRELQTRLAREKYGNVVLIGDVGGYVERETDRARELERGGSSSIREYLDDIYNAIKDSAVSTYDDIRDWLTERFDRLSWSNAVLVGDVWTEIEKASEKLDFDNMTLIGDVGGYLDGALDDARDAGDAEQGLIFDWIDKRLEGVADAFSTAFQHLAPVFASLFEIPALVFFELLSLIVTPPGAEEG